MQGLSNFKQSLRHKGEMNKPLHLLHLEDDPDFAELVWTLLQEDSLDAEVERVTSRTEFEAALGRRKFDVVLSDFRLSAFTGLEALAFVRKEYPGVPYILVSGTIGEHAAIESLKAGATDYVLKHNQHFMPNHMNGRELAEKLWAERPNLKVIFTSGYSADIVGKDFKLEPELNFLQKPYHPQTLVTTVRRCLDCKQN